MARTNDRCVEVDRGLRELAVRRAALDADELRLILEAKRLAIHVRFGQPTLRAYLERVLGHSPRAAGARMRVAEAVERLPVTCTALAEGRLSFSAVRELVRIVTPETERAWVETLAGQTVREVEKMVVGRKPGDLPIAPTEVELRPRLVRFSVRPETYHLFLRARQALERQVGACVDDDAAIAALSRAVLGELAPQPADAPEIVTPSSSQGRRAPVSPAVRRQLWRWFMGRCAVPSCPSTRDVEFHDLAPAAGRSPGPERLVPLCVGHRRSHAEGGLTISGQSPAALVFRRVGDAGPRRSRVDLGRRKQVEATLRGRGWDRVTSRLAASRALTHVGVAGSLAALVREACRQAGAIAEAVPERSIQRSRTSTNRARPAARRRKAGPASRRMGS